MTTEEFKVKYPQYKDLEGNELWDTMEKVFLEKPKKYTYTLRWLFYKKRPSFKLKNNFTSTLVCNKCKKGVTNYLAIWDASDEFNSASICPHCNTHNMELVKNTNLNHKIWLLYKKVENIFWTTLDRLHICRYSNDGRYGMFGDESYYVESVEFDKNRNYLKTNFRKRKWWEYIIIKKFK